MAIFDITVPISGGMPVWPGDPPVEITHFQDAETGVSISRLSFGSHIGTHVDAPAHFLPDGMSVDEIQLSLLVGTAWVTDLSGLGDITATALAAAGIPSGTRRLLIRTDNSERTTPVTGFQSDFVALTPEAARWLLEHDIRLVGIDAPSIEPFVSPGEPVHRTLLGAGAIILEGLQLSHIAPGSYHLCCLPLRITGGDGAPARALLMDP